MYLFSSCDRQFWPVTLVFELDQSKSKKNHYATCHIIAIDTHAPDQLFYLHYYIRFELHIRALGKMLYINPRFTLHYTTLH